MPIAKLEKQRTQNPCIQVQILVGQLSLNVAHSSFKAEAVDVAFSGELCPVETCEIFRFSSPECA